MLFQLKFIRTIRASLSCSYGLAHPRARGPASPQAALKKSSKMFLKAGFMGQQDNHSYEFGRFRLKVAERVLLREGEPVPLTPKVFDILVTRDTVPLIAYGDTFDRETTRTPIDELLRDRVLPVEIEYGVYNTIKKGALMNMAALDVAALSRFSDALGELDGFLGAVPHAQHGEGGA